MSRKNNRENPEYKKFYTQAICEMAEACNDVILLQMVYTLLCRGR